MPMRSAVHGCHYPGDIAVLMRNATAELVAYASMPEIGIWKKDPGNEGV